MAQIARNAGRHCVTAKLGYDIDLAHKNIREPGAWKAVRPISVASEAEEIRGEKQMAHQERGFAAMDEQKQRNIAAKGGHESGGNFAKDRERAAKAGAAGGRR